MAKRIVIIGAGPIGLEAALYGVTLGHEVEVFEKIEVGGNVRDWGHARMFSPWKLNVTSLGRSRLTDANWRDQDCPTGREFADAYLDRLAETKELHGRIITGASVIQIARRGKLKHDGIGNGERGRVPFRLLIRHANGKERVAKADAVLDASGVYSNPAYLGDGGIPALGELANRHRISYRLEDILGAERARYEGKTTLVVGSGHSAATIISAFKVLCEAAPGTRAIWAVRANHKRPFQVNGSDPLAERAALTKKANEIAEGMCPNIQYLTGHTVESITFDAARDQFEVTLHNGRSPLVMCVDRIVAQVGLGPDNSLYRQLQVHECYATRGPMALAAALLGEVSKDCLAQKSHGPELLRNPEPNFFIIGHKSYGTRSNFLLRVGHTQVRDVFRLIHGDPQLNLYGEEDDEASVPATPLSR